MLDIFLEEADELLVGIDADLNTWTADQQNVGALKNLMRYLHTLKGGSNMIQAGHIGLIAHELETIYEKLKSYPELKERENLESIAYVLVHSVIGVVHSQLAKDRNFDSEIVNEELKNMIKGFLLKT